MAPQSSENDSQLLKSNALSTFTFAPCYVVNGTSDAILPGYWRGVTYRCKEGVISGFQFSLFGESMQKILRKNEKESDFFTINKVLKFNHRRNW
jgi:hypothetical protein